MSGRVLRTTVVQAVIIWSRTLKGERPLFVVDLMALLGELHSVFEPLACGPARESRGSTGVREVQADSGMIDEAEREEIQEKPREKGR